jgi:hypothetical protein
MAKFLQETVRGSGLKMDNVIKSDEFKRFFRKVSCRVPYVQIHAELTCRSDLLERLPPTPMLSESPSYSMMISHLII